MTKAKELIDKCADMSEAKEIILKTKLIGYMSGKKLNQPYRAVMKQDKGKWLLRIDQKFDSGAWDATGGGWHLSDLLKDPSDTLSIDYGQGWSVTGMSTVLKEAITHI